mmetsp:Transcript_35878/g.114893  ORF Transcript_35878/g.114893 Transcript_35878/m.114893 type:complete len:610 (-) Transcript_35878:806-2635(-)
MAIAFVGRPAAPAAAAATATVAAVQPQPRRPSRGGGVSRLPELLLQLLTSARGDGGVAGRVEGRHGVERAAREGEAEAESEANLADRHREELEEEVVVKRAVGALRVGEVGQLPALRLVKGDVHQRGRAFRGRRRLRELASRPVARLVGGGELGEGEEDVRVGLLRGVLEGDGREGLQGERGRAAGLAPRTKGALELGLRGVHPLVQPLARLVVAPQGPPDGLRLGGNEEPPDHLLVALVRLRRRREGGARQQQRRLGLWPGDAVLRERRGSLRRLDSVRRRLANDTVDLEAGREDGVEEHLQRHHLLLVLAALRDVHLEGERRRAQLGRRHARLLERHGGLRGDVEGERVQHRARARDARLLERLRHVHLRRAGWRVEHAVVAADGALRREDKERRDAGEARQRLEVGRRRRLEVGGRLPRRLLLLRAPDEGEETEEAAPVVAVAGVGDVHVQRLGAVHVDLRHVVELGEHRQVAPPPAAADLGEGRVGEAHRLRVEGVVAGPLAAHDLARVGVGVERLVPECLPLGEAGGGARAARVAAELLLHARVPADGEEGLVHAVDVAVVQPEGHVEGGRRHRADHLCARLPAAEAPQSHVRRPVRGRIEGEA